MLDEHIEVAIIGVSEYATDRYDEAMQDLVSRLTSRKDQS